ncbi:ATPase AAA domain-containing protein 5 [Rhizophlyctis rosea]|uniref:ATPase AAA domain-containing protein 5 n=1 Tax=Rhizophlyctis rosea TaxID=64517 RepID=A0AAD5WWN6_9FUNG|nr:ATPase AAA domain-containing protein 5 [Rhizophlyctis rosea]
MDVGFEAVERDESGGLAAWLDSFARGREIVLMDEVASVLGQGDVKAADTGDRKDDINLVKSIYPADLLDSLPYSQLLNSVTLESAPTPTNTDLWTERYRPQNTSEMIGKANASTISFMMSWLEGWKAVPNCEGIDSDSDGWTRKRKGGRRKEGRAKKKTKRKSDMDNFIVSDDDVLGWDGSSDSSSLDATSSAISRHLMLKGPSGCGKTSLVYAAAAQCGYEVLELNCGMRRSGKDVMSGFGEATQSHTVGKGGGKEELKDVLKRLDERESSKAPVGMEVEVVIERMERGRGKGKRKRKGKGKGSEVGSLEGSSDVDPLQLNPEDLEKLESSTASTPAKAKKKSRRKVAKVEPEEEGNVETGSEAMDDRPPPRRKSSRRQTAAATQLENDDTDVINVEDAPEVPTTPIFIRLNTTGWKKMHGLNVEIPNSAEGSNVKAPIVNDAATPAPDPQPAAEPQGDPPKPDITSTPAVAAPARKTLILLDEVDIISEHDKGFWSGVAQLIEKSKRPVVFTCNGEISDLSFKVVDLSKCHYI